MLLGPFWRGHTDVPSLYVHLTLHIKSTISIAIHLVSIFMEQREKT